MQYQNMDIHNVAELIPHKDGGVTWLRVPKQVYEQMEREQGKRMCENCTGVELRFVLKGEKAVIHMERLSGSPMLSTFHIFFGGIQSGWQQHELDQVVSERSTSFEIKRPNNLDLLKRVSEDFKLDWDPEVVRVIFDRCEYRIIGIEGDVVPPTREQLPEKTWLAYGSSITHGSNSYDASHAWTSVVAHNLNVDLRNLGMAGSCCMEPAMIDYIASEGEKGAWDIATLELGINVLSWDDEKIEERAADAIRQVAGRNPDKPVFVISPFYSNDDYRKDSEHHADRWRVKLEEIVRREKLPNVTYINGLELLGDMSLISGDAVHPNIYGVQQIADRLTARMKAALLDKY